MELSEAGLPIRTWSVLDALRLPVNTKTPSTFGNDTNSPGRAAGRQAPGTDSWHCAGDDEPADHEDADGGCEPGLGLPSPCWHGGQGRFGRLSVVRQDAERFKRRNAVAQLADALLTAVLGVVASSRLSVRVSAAGNPP